MFFGVIEKLLVSVVWSWHVQSFGDLRSLFPLRISVSTFTKHSSKALKKQNFLDDLSNSVRPFDYIVKAGQPARPKTKNKDRYRKRRSHATVSIEYCII